MPKLILHLCADTGSDSWPYRLDPDYEVITIGADIGVENYHPDRPVHGIIANPVCTEFSAARYGAAFGGGDTRPRDEAEGLVLVKECLRVIDEALPDWYAIENPATGLLRNHLGTPDFTYEPWQFGSPWTKRTALWGHFNAPTPVYTDWDDVPKIEGLYARPGRKPSIAFMHKSAFALIPELAESGMPTPTTDAEFRSLASQQFARAFKAANP